MKFLEIFNPVIKGNFGLTEQAIYKSLQYGGEFIPIWGGNQEHETIDRLVSVNGRTKSDEPITVFSGEGIIISLDGSSGAMTYKKGDQKFALNHHAGFFSKKITKEKQIDLEFFSIFYQKQLQEMSVSEGSKTLTLEQLYEADFEIPIYDDQIKIMKEITPIITLKNKLNLLIESKIDELLEKQIVSN
jgi:hypothetical protein